MAAIWRHWRVQLHFAEQPDPSARSVASYKLEDIVMITLCAVVSGFEHWIAIEDFGNEHEPWRRTFLKFPNSIPSHDALNDVIDCIDKNAVSQVGA
ncbi:transposase family protein [Bordetella tumulicola]